MNNSAFAAETDVARGRWLRRPRTGVARFTLPYIEDPRPFVIENKGHELRIRNAETIVPARTTARPPDYDSKRYRIEQVYVLENRVFARLKDKRQNSFVLAEFEFTMVAPDQWGYVENWANSALMSGGTLLAFFPILMDGPFDLGGASVVAVAGGIATALYSAGARLKQMMIDQGGLPPRADLRKVRLLGGAQEMQTVYEKDSGALQDLVVQPTYNELDHYSLRERMRPLFCADHLSGR